MQQKWKRRGRRDKEMHVRKVRKEETSSRKMKIYVGG
jgi:hypothetical protein